MRIYLLLLIILTVTSATGQRAPVRYIPIDSISFSLRGHNAKLDFKGKTKHDGRVPTAYPWLRNAKPTGTYWTGDTINLTINNEKIEFIERKGLGIDYYFFPAEYLESTTYKQQHTMRISSSIIKETRPDSILFLMTIELVKKKNRRLKQVYLREQNIWIKRKDLDGVLIRDSDLE